MYRWRVSVIASLLRMPKDPSPPWSRKSATRLLSPTAGVDGPVGGAAGREGGATGSAAPRLGIGSFA
eukprot:5109974-Pyramimonas_sp.AAC.1